MDKEETPVPIRNRNRSAAKRVEPESIQQVRERSNSRAKSVDKEGIPVTIKSRRRSGAKHVEPDHPANQRTAEFQGEVSGQGGHTRDHKKQK